MNEGSRTFCALCDELHACPVAGADEEDQSSAQANGNEGGGEVVGDRVLGHPARVLEVVKRGDPENHTGGDQRLCVCVV